jgi:hypothetical protein
LVGEVGERVFRGHLSSRAKQAGECVVVEADDRRAGLPQHLSQRRPDRSAAPQRQQQVRLRL